MNKRHVFLLVSSLFFLLQIQRTVPDQPYRNYTPPEWYEAIWDLTWNLCTSKFKDEPARGYHDIKWYIVDATYFNKRLNKNEAMAAMTYTPMIGRFSRVYVAQPYIKDIPTIAHEMMHVQGVSVGAFNEHPPFFEECGQCIKSAIANFQRGLPVPCTGS